MTRPASAAHGVGRNAHPSTGTLVVPVDFAVTTLRGARFDCSDTSGIGCSR